MHRKITLIIYLLLLLNICDAQYVTIPSQQFKTLLQNRYPSCFNAAGLLDTTCSEIVNEDTLIITTYIGNAEGLRYFKNLVYLTMDRYSGYAFPEMPSTLQYLNATNCRIPVPRILPALPSGLKYLNCEGSNFDSLPPLPTGLKYLNCSEGYIKNLGSLTLPDSLEYFTCIGTGVITDLPTLPANLKSLFCDRLVQLNSLPELPAGLDSLSCGTCRLRSLPELPSSLSYLNCPGNNFSALPALPSNLITLNCSDNKLSALPALPSNLKTLDCGANDSLSQLPALPEGLIYLNCSGVVDPWMSGHFGGQLTSLPALPLSLQSLYCASNRLTSVPTLPAGLVNFGCSNNLLSTLPPIPHLVLSLNISNNRFTELPQMSDSVTTLFIQGNEFSQLSDLPDSLNVLYCDLNRLTALPLLPKKLGRLICSYNQLQSLPALPASLGTLVCNNNNIYCLPKLPPNLFQLQIDEDNIHCLPNIPAELWEITSGEIDSITQNPIYIQLPLCNPTNNISHCQSAPVISGNVFYDNNNNGIKDANEYPKSNVKFELSNGSIAYTNNHGYFEIGTDSLVTYTITPTAPDYYNIVPASANYNFTTYDTLVSQGYALQANTSKDSLTIKLTPLNWAARPGFSFPYLISYENAGTTTLSPAIVFDYDDTKLTYDSSSNAAIVNNGNNLSLSAGSFMPVQQGSFTAYFRVKTTIALGDSIVAKATVTNGATTAADSNKVFIRGSFDPNDKQATPELSPLQVANGTYIDYTIRFQNTGTDTAFNVVISDTLTSGLLANTFEMISSSHTCKTTIRDNIVFFEFINILLPDSNINETKSHGFVCFRIKPHSSVPSGATVTNKAAIYFDYNLPVITNTAETFIKPFVVVPLTLISFTAVPQNDNTTALYWNTANEINTKHFVIEQSNDGRSFTTVTNTVAKGKASNSYAITVADITTGIIFFRLKIVDHDGSFVYSPIIKMDKRKNSSGINVVSNPAKDFIVITTTDRMLNNTSASIINMQGAVLKTFTVKEGSQTIAIKDLPAGVYYLRTMNGSSRIVVQ